MMGLLFFRRWQPDRDFVAAPLRTPRALPMRLDRFPLGVDNAHIDVVITPELMDATRNWVNGVVREEVQRSFWHDSQFHPDRQAVEVFRKRYEALSRIVVHESRAQARLEWLQLYLVAMLKLLLSEVDAALARLREEVERQRSDAGARLNGRSLTLHENLVSLSRHLGLVRYRCCHQVMRQLARQEQTGLRKLRDTVLGVAWPVPEAMLFNPLLELGGLSSEEAFLNHYPLLLRDEDTAFELQHILLWTLSNWLPDGVGEGLGGAATGQPALQRRLEQGELPGYVEVERRLRLLVSNSELSAKAHSWFDDPDNIVLLLGGKERGEFQPGPWRHPHWQRQQRRVLERLCGRLSRAGLLRRAAASYALADLYPATGLKDNTGALVDYLSGRIGRGKLLRRLENASTAVDSARLLKQLQGAARQIKRELSGDGERLLTVRLVSDFCRLRRDLKLAWQAYRAMDAIRLLRDPQEIALSRANGLLQGFHEAVSDRHESNIIGHVILKADVRGSTRITALMRERNLNPAAYFSRNLYGPINALLKAYDASKVFVEGDAVILMLVERPEMQLAVARACGLARKILGVIQAKNAESRRHGLPELEIGLGIAYSDEPPTYLYDEGHRITISPAINRADQLSSCHPAVKALNSPVLRASHGLEVIHPVSQGRQPTKDMEQLLRYNVNGIELDTAAFQRLRGELRLQERQLPQGEGRPPQRYHIGRFQDASDAAHWLVVREAPVWLLVGNELVPGDATGRSFYEVVSNPELIQQVCKSESDSESLGIS